jgi:uncharacterized protein YcfJ
MTSNEQAQRDDRDERRVWIFFGFVAGAVIGGVMGFACGAWFASNLYGG